MGKACVGKTYADGAYIGGAFSGGACAGKAYTDGACVDGVCTGGAFADGACGGRACTDGACGDGAYTDRACVGKAHADRACVDEACDIIYGKSPISLGNSGFVYIEGPTKILLSLQEAKNPLVLIWFRTSSLIHSIWSSLCNILYKNCIIVTCLLTHTP